MRSGSNRISSSISTSTKGLPSSVSGFAGYRYDRQVALPTLIALCSVLLKACCQPTWQCWEYNNWYFTMIKVDELANTLQVCLDSGAKVLIPSTSFVDFTASVQKLIDGAFRLIPYQSAEDAVFKALGVE